MEKANGWPPLLYECDAFNLVDPGWSCGRGTYAVFVYDRSTGELTAAAELMQSETVQTCLAGPSATDFVDFGAAHCTSFQCDPTDSGGPGCVRYGCTEDAGEGDGSCTVTAMPVTDF